MGETFSLHSSCDVEVYDLISELKIAGFTLPEIPSMSREVGCYPDIFIAYCILFTIPVTNI